MQDTLDSVRQEGLRRLRSLVTLTCGGKRASSKDNVVVAPAVGDQIDDAARRWLTKAWPFIAVARGRWL